MAHALTLIEAHDKCDYLLDTSTDEPLIISDDSDPSNVELNSTDERSYVSYTADGNQKVSWVTSDMFIINVINGSGSKESIKVRPYIERNVGREYFESN
jgi:hypothetical protein